MDDEADVASATAVDSVVKAAQLESQLAQTELKALKQQLHPHVLFNTMNTIAVLVRERLRHSDVFVRWGGEEFMILATETMLPQAIALAQTLRMALHGHSFPDIGLITASFGVAEYHADETLDQWLKRVDDLVYEVKREGRDQISHRRIER